MTERHGKSVETDHPIWQQRELAGEKTAIIATLAGAGGTFIRCMATGVVPEAYRSMLMARGWGGRARWEPIMRAIRESGN